MYNCVDQKRNSGNEVKKSLKKRTEVQCKCLNPKNAVSPWINARLWSIYLRSSVLFIYLFIYVFIYLLIYFLFINLFINLFVYILMYLFMYLFIYVFIYLYTLFIYLLIYLFVYLFIEFIYVFNHQKVVKFCQQ